MMKKLTIALLLSGIVMHMQASSPQQNNYKELAKAGAPAGIAFAAGTLAQCKPGLFVLPISNDTAHKAVSIGGHVAAAFGAGDLVLDLLQQASGRVAPKDAWYGYHALVGAAYAFAVKSGHVPVPVEVALATYAAVKVGKNVSKHKAAK